MAGGAPESTLANPARNLLRGKNDPGKWIVLQIDWVSKGVLGAMPVPDRPETPTEFNRGGPRL